MSPGGLAMAALLGPAAGVGLSWGGAAGPVATTSPVLDTFEDLYVRMRDPEHGLKIADRRWRLMTYTKCFVGTEAVDWMTQNLSITRREDAVKIGQQLMDSGILHHVTSSEPFADQHYYYRFQEDEESKILNMKRVWLPDVIARPALEVAQELITKLACLVEEFRIRRQRSNSGVAAAGTGSPYTPEGLLGTVKPQSDYEAIRESEQFRSYVFATAELQRVDLAALDHEEKLVFFVNIYNALCMHCHIVAGPPANFFRRWIFFRTYSYRISGLDYTLDDIEHGILRGNKKPPSFKFKQQLGYNDPKCEHVLKERDGRIHFVISAGTQSDPPVRILDPETVEEELHDGTSEFLRQTVKIDLARRSISLPRIFFWYSDDFPQPEPQLLRFIEQYLSAEQQAQLTQLLNMSESPSIIYENFNWQNPEARFEAAVVRRKRKRIERELDGSKGISWFGPSPKPGDPMFSTPEFQDPSLVRDRRDLYSSPPLAETVIGLGGEGQVGLTGPLVQAPASVDIQVPPSNRVHAFRNFQSTREQLEESVMELRGEIRSSSPRSSSNEVSHQNQ